ncbi:MAG TPA: aminoglycoside phosphotransferase family protein [Kribbella sp.]|nr:aminoglycoside phosphotransferase family protein [Kribbella sp.]HET6292621.1 aminoglycoside phosphotransferase family protein [Kribbella sp.]
MPEIFRARERGHLDARVVPESLIALHAEDEDWVAWLKALPELAATYLERWALTIDGRPLHGAASLVLPVAQEDGTPAMLKLQPLNEENAGEALALRTWNGDGVVRVLQDDQATGTLLLERLHPRSLNHLPDDVEATRILAELLARLSAVPAPPGLRTLADVAAAMLDDAPALIPLLADPAEQSLVLRCAARLAELVKEPGDRLLHWDLHYENVLASDREPWLVIDPKPLAGDPCFELFAALNNRWDDLVATGEPARALRRRFELMLDVVGLDRERAIGWTLARILQNVLWDLEGGGHQVEPVQVAIAEVLMTLSV